MQDNHFNKIFWFAVGVALFAAAYSVYVTIIDKTHIAMILTFWLSTGAAGSIGYLIGASVKGKASEGNAPEGTTKADFTASIITEPKEQEGK